MNDSFVNQKEKLLAIKQEISLLYQQVSYLLRNEKPIELLDLDVLMNRTHTIYDQLCAINLGEEGMDEDLPLDAEALAGLFGGMMQEPEETEEEKSQDSVVEESVAEQVPEQVHEQVLEQVEEPQDVPTADVPREEETQEKDAIVIQPVVEEQNPVVDEPAVSEPAVQQEEKPLGDEFGFFFRFEEVPEEERIQHEETIEKDGKVVHVMEEIPEEEIPERDRVHGEDLVQDNPFVMPKMDGEKLVLEPEDMGRASSEHVADYFEKDDTEFELSTGDILGEKMMGEDNSLAAKLQQNPGRDLRTVIGINDKFLFVNELFGGSMEKYNKSIDNLNDLKTLNGALIYLNELKIELQWNNSNEAYQKLADLVRRKFE